MGAWCQTHLLTEPLLQLSFCGQHLLTGVWADHFGLKPAKPGVRANAYLLVVGAPELLLTWPCKEIEPCRKTLFETKLSTARAPCIVGCSALNSCCPYVTITATT
jgi:hypothetical protein